MMSKLVVDDRFNMTLHIDEDTANACLLDEEAYGDLYVWWKRILEPNFKRIEKYKQLESCNKKNIVFYGEDEVFKTKL